MLTPLFSDAGLKLSVGLAPIIYLHPMNEDCVIFLQRYQYLAFSGQDAENISAIKGKYFYTCTQLKLNGKKVAP